MNLTKSQKFILAINIFSVIGFGWYYIQSFNYEFVAYAGLIVVIIGFLYATLSVTKFPTYIVAGITLWGILHMMGGSIPTSDGVLYAWRIFPFFDGGGDFYILKMDQVIHAYLYGVVALMFLHLLKRYFLIRHSSWLVAFIAVMAALGVSAVNEILEFTAVVMLPETGVGGYYNTLLDIIFNLGGAILAIIMYTLFSKRHLSSVGRATHS